MKPRIPSLHKVAKPYYPLEQKKRELYKAILSFQMILQDEA